MQDTHAAVGLLRDGIFVAAITLFFGMAITTVMRALWPARFEGAAARVTRREIVRVGLTARTRSRPG
jgi:hypothetical protein